MSDARAALVERLGHVFADTDLLEAALTHRSARSDHNERLEFLGDSILNMVIAEGLYLAHPGLHEGELTRLRAELVRAETLAEVAAELGLGEVMNLGAGELKSGSYRRGSILGDAVEALIGAVYLDAGFETARAMVLRMFSSRLEVLPDPEALKDPKTRLQEWLQGRGHERPEYELQETSGPAHRQRFRVACVVADLGLRVEADGDSRRKAEQAAAADAMLRLERAHG